MSTMEIDQTKEEQDYHVNVKDLTFGYPDRPPVLQNLNVQLTGGARCLLIGANGAGK
jgi:ABC-type bacteriocin/lantibiotic exporter with double-glycine peptidase domain